MRLTRYRLKPLQMSSNPIQGRVSFIWETTVLSLLSTGCSQESFRVEFPVLQSS